MHTRGYKTTTKTVKTLLSTLHPSVPLPKSNHCYPFLVYPSDVQTIFTFMYLLKMAAH